MVGPVERVITRGQSGSPTRRQPGTGLLIAGAIAFAAALVSYAGYKFTHSSASTSSPVDLHVYRIGGLIVRHIRPYYDPHRATPLYDYPGYGRYQLKFTYPPFAAVVFAVLSFIPWSLLLVLTDLAQVVFLVAALWFTFGGLGYRQSSRVRLGATLLTAGAVFWTEPVIRTIYVGQVNLALMALIMWDLCQPDTKASRWWKGAGVGIAAGIKLVPLIFIPYLLLTRKFRQAAVASAAFAATVVIPFAFAPADSAKWWFGGLFINDAGRTGFLGWVANQSLRGLIARLMGSVAGSDHVWLAAAAVTAVIGLAAAALLDRKGHAVAGILTCALTGLLVSPVSWDHHWVWVVPGVAVAAHYATAAMAAGTRPAVPGQAAWRRWARRAGDWAYSLSGVGYWALAAGMLVIYWAWPGGFWGKPKNLPPFSMGMIWAPNTYIVLYNRVGDQPWLPEYHWHGLQLLTGNGFVLGGLALLVILVVLALIAPAQRPSVVGPAVVGPAMEGPAVEPERPAAVQSGAVLSGAVPPAAVQPGAVPDRLEVPQGAGVAAPAPDTPPLGSDLAGNPSAGG
jgi:alpha-1,2-mannosyltransferase